MFEPPTKYLAVLTVFLFPVLLAAGLWLPGWLVGRALRLPTTAGGAFLGSAALLLNLILLLDAGGLPLTLGNIGCALGFVCGLSVWNILRRGRPAIPTTQTQGLGLRWDWFCLPAGIGLAALTVRAAFDPLSGFDTPFRWDFLARQMFSTGSLDFYPASETSDFLNYAWCDGIAPLVSGLYLWAYLSLGKITAWASTPIVFLQAVLLFQALGNLAGSSARTLAYALAASSSVLLWGVGMGQETGLTALSLCLMLLFLDRHGGDTGGGWLLWAGVAAGTGALAREYALIYPVIGVFTLRWQGARWGDCLRFLATVATVALPWYLRNWVKTGNPLWPHELGGLLPGNFVQASYYRSVGEIHSLLTHPEMLGTLALLLLALTLVPLAPGLAAGIATGRKAVPKLAALTVVFFLWLWSLSQTSGGPAYSLRVLTPALALGSALGAGYFAPRIRTGARLITASILTVTAFDSGIRSLYLPIDPYVHWWREPAQSWRTFGRLAARWRDQPQWSAIAAAAGQRLILVSDPLCHASLVERGAHALPFFSPNVHFLFCAGSDFPADLARLRALGFRFVVLTRHNTFQDRQLAENTFFASLTAYPPTLDEPLYRVYDLYSPALMAARVHP